MRLFSDIFSLNLIVVGQSGFLLKKIKWSGVCQGYFVDKNPDNHDYMSLKRLTATNSSIKDNFFTVT